MKTEVYSWRVSAELKTGLEREARRRKTSLSAVLEAAAQEWLKKNGADRDDEREQKRLHEAASKFVGAISSGEFHPSTKVREVVRERLRRRYGR
ncbi:MAG TPA: ribbon-helix-helix protein, CopG family [Bryobacteraceae bacterium]|nr:ribbon-helix-helix protein, CopG family [Bryobacteraceae bacterium]